MQTIFTLSLKNSKTNWAETLTCSFGPYGIDLKADSFHLLTIGKWISYGHIFKQINHVWTVLTGDILTSAQEDKIMKDLRREASIEAEFPPSPDLMTYKDYIGSGWLMMKINGDKRELDFFANKSQEGPDGEKAIHIYTFDKWYSYSAIWNVLCPRLEKAGHLKPAKENKDKLFAILSIYQVPYGIQEPIMLKDQSHAGVSEESGEDGDPDFVFKLSLPWKVETPTIPSTVTINAYRDKALNINLYLGIGHYEGYGELVHTFTGWTSREDLLKQIRNVMSSMDALQIGMNPEWIYDKIKESLAECAPKWKHGSEVPLNDEAHKVGTTFKTFSIGADFEDTVRKVIGIELNQVFFTKELASTNSSGVGGEGVGGAVISISTMETGIEISLTSIYKDFGDKNLKKTVEIWRDHMELYRDLLRKVTVGLKVDLKASDWLTISEKMGAIPENTKAYLKWVSDEQEKIIPHEVRQAIIKAYPDHTQYTDDFSKMRLRDVTSLSRYECNNIAKLAGVDEGSVDENKLTVYGYDLAADICNKINQFSGGEMWRIPIVHQYLVSILIDVPMFAAIDSRLNGMKPSEMGLAVVEETMMETVAEEPSGEAHLSKV